MSLIRNVKKMSQVIDFTGLSKGSIHPTDIDLSTNFASIIRRNCLVSKISWCEFSIYFVKIYLPQSIPY